MANPIFVDSQGNSFQPKTTVSGPALVPSTIIDEIFHGGTVISSGNPLPVSDSLSESALGTPADAVWSGSGSGTNIAILKAVWTKLGATTLGAGTAVVGKVGIQVASLDVNATTNAVPSYIVDGAGTGNKTIVTANNADAVAVTTTGAMLSNSDQYVFNGTTWDRRRAATGTVGVAAVNTEGNKATFSSSAVALVPTTTSATDIFVISPSSTKTVRVTRIQISATATAASFDLQLIRRSTLDTAGTAATSTANPTNNIAAHDPSNDTVSAVLTAYTANPSLGASAGIIRSQKYSPQAAAAVSVAVVWDFTQRNGKGIVLTKNTTQQLCINLGSVSLASPSFDIDIEWTEES